MDFDWDPKKAKANKLKHGVDFELAKDVFRDPACLSSLDDSSADEERWRVIGLVGGKVLFVVFTERDNDVIRIISARKRTNVKSESTLVRRRLKGGQWYAVSADGTERRLPDKAPDWSRLDVMTDAQKLAAARSDPDAQPSTEAQLKRMRRVPFAKHVRWTMGLSQQEFAKVFGIPIGTLRDWEQGRFEPDGAARSYLKVIARNPKAVRKALEPAE
jgi:putative transcriptional regulator